MTMWYTDWDIALMQAKIHEENSRMLVAADGSVSIVEEPLPVNETDRVWDLVVASSRS